MSQNNLTIPLGPWTEANFPFPYIKHEPSQLYNKIFKHGSITKIDTGKEGFPKDTILRILDDEGHKYESKGEVAYDAINRKYRRVQQYQEFYFFANEETKAVVYILHD